VPCGKIEGGLPVGLQIFGPAFGEGRVLQLAQAFEAAGGGTV
jgi:Asp-tRNA(Asn)/Glu-tRNA(Gln) amidotransferase A subunit family amidase